ncbi:MAG: hypothetical protein GXX99_00615 [Clostridiales bacterium]|nr:hypothetical protein [Clostridiales bacterium]
MNREPGLGTPPGPTLIDNRPQRKKRRASRRRRLILALLLIMAALLLLIFRHDIDFYALRLRLTGRSEAGGAPQDIAVDLSLNLSGNLACGTLRDRVILATPTRLMVYRSDGSVSLDEAVSLTDPAIACSDRYFLAYDRGGTRALLCSGTRVAARIESPTPILRAEVAQNGSFALVTLETDKFSAARVYDRQGDLRYEWNSATSHIQDAALSGDGRRLVTAGFTAQDAELVGVLRLLNCDEVEPYAEHLLPGELILDLAVDGQTLLVLTDAALYRYDLREGGQTARQPHGDKQLLYYALDGASASLVLGRYAVGFGSSLRCYDGGGEPALELQLEGDIRGLRVGGGQTTVLQSGTVSVYGPQGELLSRLERPSVKEALLLSNGLLALIDETRLALITP